jgi:L-asparagine oxygenase
LRLFDRHEGNQGLLRWDEVFVRPASPAGEIGVQQLKEYLSRAKPMSIALAGRGDSPNLQHFVQRLIVPERLYLRLAF